MMINNLQVLSTYVHDQDFKYILNKLKESYVDQANILEKELNKFSIKSPEPNTADVISLGASEVASDKFIARVVYSLMQLLLGKCMKIIKEIIYKDNIRQLLIKITKDEILRFFNFVKYMRTKGWLENPPLYPNIKGNDIVAAN